jgi:hypothetical protein
LPFVNQSLTIASAKPTQGINNPMTTTQDQAIGLHEAMQRHLHARPVTKSIGTLLQSKRKVPDFKPYYQRNYVWDNDKATYFIESVLLGIEIPPLIMFAPINSNLYEVIDGRQRFETLLKFYHGDLKLTQKGLFQLKKLKGFTYDNLEPEIKRIFLNTTLRLIEFSTLGDYGNQAESEDLIKKEVFWRYNSGITPLKALEVQRAKHLYDTFTERMEHEFKEQPKWLEQFQQIFFPKQNKPLTNEAYLVKIRELLVLDSFPINLYVNSGRNERVEMLYDLIIEQSQEQESIIYRFIHRINWLYELKSAMQQSEPLIYQGVFWALSILDKNDVELTEVLDDAVIIKLSDSINELISGNNDEGHQPSSKKDVFTGADKTFNQVTKQRFGYLAGFFNQVLEAKGIEAVNFKPFLYNRAESLYGERDGNNEELTSPVSKQIEELDNMRLNRPDAVSKTIEDLIREMNQSPFLIRPPYQRKEVINNAKSSGIIESMLLGIPLPTVFIYRRNDGTCEVIDGQQRLLSILGYLGEAYINELGVDEMSDKNKYKLSKQIRVLTAFRGEPFHQLPVDAQNRIWDFELSVVYIDQKLNKESFDPIDLFIRLNNKPYPVKDHTFEMWNSYGNRAIIEAIKRIADITAEEDNWFAFRVDNKRMHNEELFTIFAYLTALAQNRLDAVFDKVDIYLSPTKTLIFRLSKVLVSEWLKVGHAQHHNIEERDNVLSSVEQVKAFIEKVRVLAQNLPVATDGRVMPLKQRVNKLLALEEAIYRRQKNFYIIWFLLLNIDSNTVNAEPQRLAQTIIKFFADYQSLPENSPLKAKDHFEAQVRAFWAEFNDD